MHSPTKRCWPTTILVRLMKHSTNGLGIVVSPKHQNSGLIIADLIRGSDAVKTGLLKPGDTILKVNNRYLDNLPYDDCLKCLQELPVEVEVEILVKVPSGYTTRLVTTFSDDGVARTSRVTNLIPGCESPSAQRKRESVMSEKAGVEGHANEDGSPRIANLESPVVQTRRESLGRRESLTDESVRRLKASFEGHASDGSGQGMNNLMLNPEPPVNQTLKGSATDDNARRHKNKFEEQGFGNGSGQRNGKDGKPDALHLPEIRQNGNGVRASLDSPERPATLTAK
ncbi:hypothetical protein JTE90_018663 [Oedothorax gibbosus]|uniref:PDZ domain-containing protein n=1 Tax=Oedothorax gibbosus TaxID=931172 RepID=A0AAV6UEG1_9ARAC|nr:hypothetical protein JTE90_018663 [Oedothorax gibbosus]